MKEFSTAWKASKAKRKQRKYRFNAPLHIRSKFLNVHLTKELRKKYSIRAIRVRKGDKVKIMRGKFKKTEGKVDRVNTRRSKIFVSKAEFTKKDGSKAYYPLEPSNLMILELNTEDKKRVEKLNSKVKKETAKKEEKKE